MGVCPMRPVAWGAISLLCLAASPAAAQSFAQTNALRDAAFAPSPLVRYQTGEILLKQDARGSVDSLRINSASRLWLPARGQADTRAVDVTMIRTWPEAVSGTTLSGLQFDVSPHAGLGVSSRGGQAEAGAVLRVSKSRGAAALEQLRDMGVADGLDYGDRGRWYFFAAASGRAVGLNMLSNDSGGWYKGGWSTDETTDLVGDAQVGVGWKRGDMQTSFGVIHREVKGRHMVFHQDTRDDTVAAFTLTIKPSQK